MEKRTANSSSQTAATPVTPESEVAGPSHAAHDDRVSSHSSRPAVSSQKTRPFRPLTFCFGFALAGGGLLLMIFVAFGVLHDAGANGAVSLPATGLSMILGLMLLGGGFGQMAVSAPRFDDSEFDRLLNGNLHQLESTMAAGLNEQTDSDRETPEADDSAQTQDPSSDAINRHDDDDHSSQTNTLPEAKPSDSENTDPDNGNAKTHSPTINRAPRGSSVSLLTTVLD